MKTVLLFLAALLFLPALVACQEAATQGEIRAEPVEATDDSPCGKPAEEWIGQAPDRVWLDAREKPVRVYHEGDAVTMDFIEERLNVVLDEDDKVVRLTCG